MIAFGYCSHWRTAGERWLRNGWLRGNFNLHSAGESVVDIRGCSYECCCELENLIEIHKVKITWRWTYSLHELTISLKSDFRWKNLLVTVVRGRGVKCYAPLSFIVKSSSSFSMNVITNNARCLHTYARYYGLDFDARTVVRFTNQQTSTTLSCSFENVIINFEFHYKMQNV